MHLSKKKKKHLIKLMHVVLPYMKHQFGYIIYAITGNSL